MTHRHPSRASTHLTRRLVPLVGSLALGGFAAVSISGSPVVAQTPSVCEVAAQFTAPGTPGSFTVPAGVTELVVEVYGASGAGVDGHGGGGLGGLVSATVTVDPGDELEIRVGGQGANVLNAPGSPTPTPSGGWNGGGNGGTGPTVTGGGHGGGGGGGASEIRRDDNSLVAIAGGGGGGAHGGTGGAGGQNGATGTLSGTQTPGATAGQGGTGGAGGAAGVNGSQGGATPTAGSPFQGGNGGTSVTTQPDAGGGGGGGWYGGGGGGGAHGTAQGSGAPGGGGSSATGAGVSGATYQPGVRSGNGLVRIAYTDPDCTDLGITKTAAITTGRTIEFTLEVTNHGPNDATGVTVTDALPQEVTYVSDDCGGSDTPAPWTWDIGELDVGDSEECVITVLANTSGSITNTADVEGDQAEPSNDPNPNEDSDGVVIPELVDLEIGKSAAPSIVRQGDTVTYTLTASNNGPDDATGVVVTDTIPAGATYVSNNCGGTNTPPWTWNIGDLDAGDSETCAITVQAAATAPSTVTNTATVAGNETEATLANNTDSASFAVRTEAELAITKAAAPTSVAVGDQVTYTLVVVNNGPDTATGVTVVDALPSGVRYISDDCGGTNTPPWTWSIGTLAVGGSETCAITVEVTAAGSISNVAEVSSNEFDGVASNNTDDAVVSGVTPPTSSTTTTTSSTTTTSTSSTTTTSTSVAPSGPLPPTGGGTSPLVPAIGLLVIGGALWLVTGPSRRRGPTS